MLSEIETQLELEPVDGQQDCFSNTRRLLHPPGFRGIYGGCLIAQSLSAAQLTAPSDFSPHSMQCRFLASGTSDKPIKYVVERTRDGKSLATRTVQVQQSGELVFTATVSFVKEVSTAATSLQYQIPMPQTPGPGKEEPEDLFVGRNSPFTSQKEVIVDNDDPRPFRKRTRKWSKVRHRISAEGGHAAHLTALAYMSDSYMIATISRTSRIWTYVNAPPRRTKSLHSDLAQALPLQTAQALQTIDLEDLKRSKHLDDDVANQLDILDIQDGKIVGLRERRPELGMMASLDHVIYFHHPRGFRADEWILIEGETSWAGEGRGLVTQRFFTAGGKLIATCMQEGIFRLKRAKL